MDDLLELKESLFCAYRSAEENTYEVLIPLIGEALSWIQKLEPHVIELSKIEDGEGYWLTMMSSDFIPRPVICVHNEKDARKPYITFAWQYGTTSLEAETYGIEWRLWSAKPIGREW